MEFFPVTHVLWAALCVFLGYVVRGISGFGGGLFSTPLLVLLLPMQVVVPLNSLLVFALFIFLTWRDWRLVDWAELRRLALPTLVGVVAGLQIFRSLDNAVLVAMLGGFLTVYALYMLATKLLRLPELRCSSRWAWPAGFLGSFLDTLFGGGGGTMVVIYMHARGISDRATFRATLAVIWFIEMIARIGGYASAGYYRKEILLLVLVLLPTVWAGTWVGERLGNRVSQEGFGRVIAVLLLLSGVSLLLKAG